MSNASTFTRKVKGSLLGFWGNVFFLSWTRKIKRNSLPRALDREVLDTKKGVPTSCKLLVCSLRISPTMLCMYWCLPKTCVNVPKLEPSIWLLWWVFLKVNHKELKWRHSQDSKSRTKVNVLYLRPLHTCWYAVINKGKC